MAEGAAVRRQHTAFVYSILFAAPAEFQRFILKDKKIFNMLILYFFKVQAEKIKGAVVGIKNIALLIRKEINNSCLGKHQFRHLGFRNSANIKVFEKRIKAH